MLTTFLDKASGLLEKQFLLGWWFPVLVAGAAGLLIGIWPCGLAAALDWWATHEGLTQTWMLLGALFAVTLVAFLLQAFSRPLVQLYEGYWPIEWRQEYLRLTGLRERWEGWRQARREAAVSGEWPNYASLQDRLYHHYPSEAGRLLPTRLGNVLRAAEDYATIAYGMDTPFWWPRLAPLLPDDIQKAIRDALTPMLMLLNLASLAVLLELVGTVYLAMHQRWWAALAVLVLCPAVAWLSYEGAVTQGRAYGQTIRAAVDLHRFDLLSALHIPLPADPGEERQIWAQLAAWLYNQDRGAVRELAYRHPARK